MKISRSTLIFAPVALALGVFAPLGSGCAALMSKVTGGLAEDLSSAISDSDDPATVGEAIPAFLVMTDAMIKGSPNNSDLLFAAADLNAAYAAAFVADRERQKSLTTKAFSLARRAACLDLAWMCGIRSLDEAEFAKRTAGISRKDIATAYGLASNWVGWIQANADDWDAIADLGRAKGLMIRINELSPGYKGGQVSMLLGVFELLLPPAFGGRPELGRQHFEAAIAMSKGANLYAKVLFAEFYARMVFNQELHDFLLREVLEADPVAEGMTLQNRLAQIRAADLLEGSSEYF